MHVWKERYRYIHTHVYHTHIHTTHTYVHVNTYIHVYTYVHIYTHIYIRIHIHTHTYTHNLNLVGVILKVSCSLICSELIFEISALGSIILNSYTPAHSHTLPHPLTPTHHLNYSPNIIHSFEWHPPFPGVGREEEKWSTSVWHGFHAGLWCTPEGDSATPARSVPTNNNNKQTTLWYCSILMARAPIAIPRWTRSSGAIPSQWLKGSRYKWHMYVHTHINKYPLFSIWHHCIVSRSLTIISAPPSLHN